MKTTGFLRATICMWRATCAFADQKTPDTAPGPRIDRITERVLLDACGYLCSAKRFSVKSEISYDEIFVVSKV
jgi:hypothetical protein